LAAFGRRPPVYVAPMSLAGIRNPQQKQTFSVSGGMSQTCQNRDSSSTDAMAPGRDLDLQDSSTILQKGAERCISVCRIGYPCAAAG
jgi:hypothetical protein